MRKGESQYERTLKFRVSDIQYKKLRALSKKSGLNCSAYIRRLIDGVMPQERPPLDFYKILTQLRYISNSANQIALKANTIQSVDAAEIKQIAEELKPLANILYQYVTLPIRIAEGSDVAELYKFAEKIASQESSDR